MVKMLIFIWCIIAGNCCLAQYVHYSDDSKKSNTIAPAKPAQDSVMYHEWPDKCPGLSGSIPVLDSYVPHDIVLKLTEIYKGHLYSINSVKMADGKVQYKMKVCMKGAIVFTYADETGTLLAAQ